MSNVTSQKVLTYDDIDLYQCDIKSLCKRNGWLTDNLVNFCAAYLVNASIKEENKNKICIVYATLTEIIKYSEENNVTLYEEIGLSHNKWCFFILSDNIEPELAYGGSHWCLLVFNPIDKQFLLFDSIVLPKINKEILNFAKKLSSFFQVNTNSQLVVQFKPCPTMLVSGDCGLYLIEFIAVILKSLQKSFEKNDSKPNIDLSSIDHEFIQRSRQKWFDIICNVANK